MLTILSGDLPPTATYAARSWAWLSFGTGFVTHTRTLAGGEVIEETLPALGKLTIRVQHRRRRYTAVYVRPWSGLLPEPLTYQAGRPAAVEVDTYAVEEVEPEELGTRLFLLLNLTDSEQREPYRVTVGGANRCRCMAGVCRVPTGCKHLAALAALIEAGALEPSEELSLV